MASPDITARGLPLDGFDPDGADWLSVSALASARQVTRQSMHERIKRLASTGRLPTRGKGHSFRVHAPTFASLVAETHDPAQDLRNRHKRPPVAAAVAPESATPGLFSAPQPMAALPPPRRAARAVETPIAASPAPAPRETSAYDAASAREKHAKAAIAEMELARRRGELVPVAEFEAAASAVGLKIAQAIASLRSLATPLFAAGHAGGEDAVHAALNGALDDLLRQISGDMASILAGAPHEEVGA